jgi:MFS transporter, Spinster family, sphingosine-1-phosphate transporter
VENERRQLLACAGAFMSLPMILIFSFLVSDNHVAFDALAVANFVIAMTLGPIFGSIQTLVPPHMRAISIALVFLCANLIGMGFGPLAVGVLSDVLQPDFAKESLRYALITMCPGLFWAAWHLWRASRTVERDIAATQDQFEASGVSR